MVNMFHRNQAALLPIQLLLICHSNFAEPQQDEHRNILGSTGDPVIFTCDTSLINVTQINWIKDRFLFAYRFSLNQTFSNFSSDRVKIDSGFPSTLNIFNAQHNDTGHYRCQVTGRNGTWTATWNLTLSEKPEEIIHFNTWYLLYTLTAVTGLLLCGITSAVCLYRKCGNGTPDWGHFHLESGEEMADHQPQAETHMRRNNKRRSQYIDRLNSIYGYYH